MAIEIEAKIKVDRLDVIRERLQALDATPAGKRLETNTFFDADDRSLVAADKGLRLRVNHDQEANVHECILTFKGPRHPGQFKRREEIEVNVGSPEDATELLAALGYMQVITFEKKRESWKFKDCKVELDELPYLGAFVEIEGPSESSIGEVQRALGLSSRPLVKAGYAGLLTTHLEELDRRDRVIVFPPEDESRAGRDRNGHELGRVNWP